MKSPKLRVLKSREEEYQTDESVSNPASPGRASTCMFNLSRVRRMQFPWCGTSTTCAHVAGSRDSHRVESGHT